MAFIPKLAMPFSLVVTFKLLTLPSASVKLIQIVLLAINSPLLSVSLTVKLSPLFNVEL